jgi:hypothetical protein
MPGSRFGLLEQPILIYIIVSEPRGGMTGWWWWWWWWWYPAVGGETIISARRNFKNFKLEFVGPYQPDVRKSSEARKSWVWLDLSRRASATRAPTGAVWSAR